MNKEYGERLKIRFTSTDLGCWIDGAFGQDHRRARLRDMAEFCNAPVELINSLTENPPDDFSDEDEAIELFQQHTAHGLLWVSETGDLLLVDENDGEES